MKLESHHPRGFTLLEMLVVVGLVALLAVGIASIFNTVGETIDRGRRVSELNRSAAQIERVMRSDFERMTREGFLVIRNEYANGGDPVDLFDPNRFEGEPSQKRRRTDEIEFFARDDASRYSSEREPLDRNLIASSAVARIYYGHGKGQVRPQVRVANASIRRDPYFRPLLSDFNAGPEAALGVDSRPGERNPNEFASDWALLRSVVPLVSPNRLRPLPPDGGLRAEIDLPPGLTNLGFPPSVLYDNRVQTAMQPSVQSLFVHIARQQSSSPSNLWGGPSGYRVDTSGAKPALASGIVDVAVTDLAEIAAVVNHGALDRDDRVFWPWDINRTGTPYAGVVNPVSLTDRRHMQAWMLDAMPGNTHVTFAGTALIEDPGRWDERPRIRFEYEPPLMSIEDDYLDSPPGPQRELERAYRQADQEMLTSQIFVPRCTEFIVEWSYGLVDQDPASPTFGQMIWYGLPRYKNVGQSENPPAFTPGVDPVLALPYGATGDEPLARDVLPPLTGRPASDFGTNDKYPTRDLINLGSAPTTLFGQDVRDPSTEVSVFGYFDPGPGDLTGPASASGADPDDSSWDASSGHPLLNPSDDRPWLWPALIRVTMTIADATDPTIETTRQVVFEVPNGGLDNE